MYGESYNCALIQDFSAPDRGLFYAGGSSLAWSSEGTHDDGVWVQDLVLNEDDIRIRFEDQSRPRLRCGYCDRTNQPRTFDAALSWFHSHFCRADHIHDRAKAA